MGLITGRDNCSTACQAYKYLEITSIRRVRLELICSEKPSLRLHLIVFHDLDYRALISTILSLPFWNILYWHKIPFKWLTARTSFQTLGIFFFFPSVSCFEFRSEIHLFQLVHLFSLPWCSLSAVKCFYDVGTWGKKKSTRHVTSREKM